METLGYGQQTLQTLTFADLLVSRSRGRESLLRPSTLSLRRSDGRPIRVFAHLYPGLEISGSSVLVARPNTRVRAAEFFEHADVETGEKMREALMAESGQLVSLGTLAAGVAHEINNPLAYIKGNLEYLLRRLDTLLSTPEHLRQILSEAAEGAERIRLITRDLQMFSRHDEETLEAVDIHEVLESAISVCRNAIAHRARLFLEYESTEFVLASESRLLQVFVNLLMNAVHAIPEGRAAQNAIRIRTSLERGWTCVEIRDTGCGMSLDLQARIFDPFFTTKGVGRGTGLGLPICEGLVARMGGEIQVESEVDVGTVFRILLPTCAEVDQTLSLDAPMEAPVDPATILLIDDDAPVARSIARLLQRHQVTVVTSGRSALDLLKVSSEFDLVLCDLMMPDVNGVEIFERVRDTHPRAADRFVFMTGGVFSDATREFVLKTRHPIVQKPFDVRRIEGLLRSFSAA